MLYLIISLVLLLPYFTLLMYYRSGWNAISSASQNRIPSPSLPFISVIISARNEEKNIGPCLQSLIAQDYPAERFEIIVVDDHSEDTTAQIVHTVSEKVQQVHLLRMKDFTAAGEGKVNSYKKMAIAKAIEFARGELITTTDADCTAPASWLSTIGNYFVSEQPSMCTGPVLFLIPRTGNILKKFFFIFQSLDFMTLQGITGAAIGKKLHYMANGANLTYPKSVFQSVSGFKGIDGVASGDDILLMEKISFSGKIRYLKNRNAIVTTHPEPSLRSFLNQRIRWAGKSSAYSDNKIKWIMALVYFVNLWLLIMAIGTAFSEKALYYFLASIVFKFITDLIFLFPVSTFFRQRKLLWWFVWMEPVHIFYTVIAGWLGIFGTYTWKGRKVK